MSSFTRYAAVAAVVLSLGFLVTALPTLRVDISIPAITGKDAVSVVCAEAFAKIAVAIKLLSDCQTLVDVQAQIAVCVQLFQGCADELLKIGAGIEVDVEAKTSIVACIAATIIIFVQVCVELATRFGLQAIVEICVPLDVVIRLCLFNLNICVNGILAFVAEALVKLDVTVLVKLGLTGCMSVLGLGL